MIFSIEKGQAENIDRFIGKVRKYLDLDELTPTVLNDMVKAVYVHAPNKAKGYREQKIDISPDEIVITDRDEELIKKVMKWLEDNVSDSDVTVDNLASYVGMGRTSMYNKLKGLTGKSPVELIQEFRLEKATYYLKSGQYSVSETSYKVGFSDPGYFSRSFKKHFGLSPADYIKENRQRQEAES